MHFVKSSEKTMCKREYYILSDSCGPVVTMRHRGFRYRIVKIGWMYDHDHFGLQRYVIQGQINLTRNNDSLQHNIHHASRHEIIIFALEINKIVINIVLVLVFLLWTRNWITSGIVKLVVIHMQHVSEVTSPAIEHHATNYIRDSIRHESLTVEWLALLFVEFFGNDIDFVHTSLLYRWLPYSKVTQGSHCESPCELPVMKIKNDAFASCYFFDKDTPIRPFAERFWFLHQSFSDRFRSTKDNSRPMAEP